MKRSSVLFYLVFIFLVFSCNSDMVQEGNKSSLDPRVPDINVKQGSQVIENSDVFLLEFENGVAVNESSEPVIFTIENIGTDDLTIGGIGADNDEFLLDPSAATVLTAGTNTTFTLVFSPLDTDVKNAVITIITDDLDEAQYSFTVTARSLPVPDFSARVRRGPSPLTVEFTNKSLGEITNYAWDFDADGIVDSEESDPSYAYENEGDFTILLTVTGPGGTDYKINTNYVSTVRSEYYVIDSFIETPNYISTADINGDEYIDILCVTGEAIAFEKQYGEVVWYENDGQGRFARHTIDGFFPKATVVEGGDIDGDGDIDVVAVSEKTYEIAFWDNVNGDWDEDTNIDPGNGTIWIKNTIHSNYPGYQPRSLSLINLDPDNGGIGADSDVDILIADSNDMGKINVAWLENDNDVTGGYFDDDGIPPPNIHVLSISDIINNYWSAVAADLNNDGTLDILTSRGAEDGQNEDESGVIVWRSGDNAGNFGAQSGIYAGKDFSEIRSVTAADLDGDNIPDIIAASADDDELAWWHNNGNGTFDSKQRIARLFTGACSVTAADLDGDEDNDVAAAAEHANEISWWENDGTGGFGGRNILSTNFNGAIKVLCADLNSDGRDDVIGAARDGNKLAWWDLNADETWYKKDLTSELTGIYSAASADLDNDKDKDLIFAVTMESKIVWSRNDGSGTFISTHTIVEDFNYPGSVFTIDLDQDGDMDFLVSSFGSREGCWFENDGQANFTKHIFDNDFAAYPFGQGFYATDLDNDSDIDIAAAYCGTVANGFNDSEIVWYINDGYQNFTRTVIDSPLNLSHYILADDIDGDTFTDILGVTYGGEFAWYKNDGTGNFTKQVLIESVFDKSTSIDIADLDGDNIKDVIAGASESGWVAWWKNNNDGTFASMNLIPNSYSSAVAIQAKDINNDNNIDFICTTGSSNETAWWENDGTGNFTRRPVDIQFEGGIRVLADDFDNDTDLDIIGISEDNVTQWENNLTDFGE